MAYKIKISQLNSFQFITPEIARSAEKLFRLLTFEPEADILQFGAEVHGLYIIVEGEAEVFTDDYKMSLAVLHRGNFFGEMSLIENMASSASIRACAPGQTKTLFCSRERFAELVSQDVVFASAFYRGAATTLSRRLREMNSRIESDILQGKKVLQSILQSTDIYRKLGGTQRAVNRTGETIFTKLDFLTEELARLEKKLPEHASELTTAREFIEEVMLADFQNIDIISQQIGHLKSYIENIQRFAMQQELLDISDDYSVFAKAISSEEAVRNEDGEVVFC